MVSDQRRKPCPVKKNHVGDILIFNFKLTLNTDFSNLECKLDAALTPPKANKKALIKVKTEFSPAIIP